MRTPSSSRRDSEDATVRNSIRAMIAPLVVLAMPVLFGLPGCAQTTAGEPGTSLQSSSPRATPTPSTSAKSPHQTSPEISGPQPLPSSTRPGVISLSIPAIGLKTTQLEKLALLPDGTLAAPRNPDQAGWYAAGPLPGETGPAVIAGHIDSKTGPAVFYRLSELKPGSKITVDLSDGHTETFVVDRTLTASKEDFPTRAVYGPIPDPQLRLITCGGAYSRAAGYADNTVVFATATTP